jgi:hypothetical protein
MVCVICKLDHNIINNIICLSKLEKLIIKYNKYNKIQHMENFFQKKYYCDIENRNQIKKHKCYDCYKEFNKLESLNYHLNNQVCKKNKQYKINNKLQCKNCFKEFSKIDGLKYHINKKVCFKKEELVHNINNTTNNTTNNNTTNIQNNQNNQQIIIAVNNAEDFKKVVELIPFRNTGYDIPLSHYIDYVNNPAQAIKKFIKDQHFNPDKPDRMNILNTNRRDNRVQIFDKDEDNIPRWLTRDKYTINELLYDRGINYLFIAKDILEENGIKVDPNKEAALNKKIEEFESDPKTKKEYISMISDLTYDYHEIVEENKKETSIIVRKY